MSIIKGRFIYSAYYKNIQEMKADNALETGYYVSVIDGKYKKDYLIVDKATETGQVYEKLDNGLYALSVILSNDSTIDLKKPYNTIGPVETTVGMIEEGSEFAARDTNDVFNLLFYSSWVNVKLKTNFSSSVLVRGENNVLKYIDVEVIRATSPIVKEKSVVGSSTKELEQEWTMTNTYRIPYDNIIKRDTAIRLTLTSSLGEERVVNQLIKTQYPTYTSRITPGVFPTPVSIKSMARTFDDDFIVEGNYVNTELFVAVPETKKLKSVLDENSFEMTTSMSSYQVNLQFGEDFPTYNCYYLTPIIADNVSFRIITEEV